MAWRVLLGTWAVLATAGAVWLATGGQLSGALLVDALAAVAALVALWGVVKLPWDLYFRARYVQRSQSDSVARRVAVRPDERAETTQLARRLLALAVALHLVGAAVCAGLTWVAGGQLGWVASAAFLLTMLLRPAGAMVAHVRARLETLQRRARLPAVDAVELEQQLDRMQRALQGVREEVGHEERGLAAVGQRVDAAVQRHDRQLSLQATRHQQELDRLGLEMERALEKLSRDQEVLAGLRAFLQMVRQTH